MRIKIEIVNEMIPNNQLEQSRITPFIADEKIFFGFGASVFDAVLQEKKHEEGVYVQAMGDLATATEDVHTMKDLLAKYDFNFEDGRDHLFILENPKLKEVNDAWNKIKKLVKAGG